MRTKLSLFCDRLIEAGWLAAAAVIPAFFNVYSSRVFEPDKLTLLRVIALIMAAAFVIKTVDSLPEERSLLTWLRRLATATPLSIPVLVFLSLYILATITSVAPNVSFWGSYQRLQGTLVNISYVVVFFLTAHHLRTRTQLNRLIWVVILDAFIISFYGVLQHFRLDPLPWGGDVTMRVTSSLGNAIFLGAYLIMAIPLTLVALIPRLEQIRPQPSDPKGNSLHTVFLGAYLIAALPLTLVATIFSLDRIRLLLSNTKGNKVQTIVVHLSRVLFPIIVGTGFFGFLLKAIQYVSFGRGVSEFTSADSQVLVAGAVLALGGIVYLLKPAMLPVLVSSRLSFFLASGLTVVLEFQGAALLFSQSRGPWLGLGVGLTVFLFLVLFRNKLYWAGAVSAVFLIAVSVFVVTLNMKDSPLASLKSQSHYLERLGSLSDMDAGTSKVRLLIWFGDDFGKGALGLIMSDPIRTVIGYGPESMYVAYNRFYPPSLANLEARNASPDRSHNDFFDFLVTMGVLGLISYLAIVVVFLHFTSRLFWRSADRYTQFAVLGFMAAIVAHLVETFFGIAIAATRTHFWLYLAGAAALLLMSKQGKVLSDGGSTVAAALVAAKSRDGGGRPAIGTYRSQRARKRNKASMQSSPVTASVERSDTWISFLPLLAYLAGTAVAVPAMLLGNFVQFQDPPRIVIGGFAWLLLGMFLTAVWVKRDERPRAFCRTSRLWLYGLLVFCVGYIIVFYFLGSIIGDVFFKRAQAYDSVGRYEVSTGDYLSALWWSPTQDFYYLFLGRAYLEMAKTAGDQKSSIEVNSVDDLGKLDFRRGVTLSRNGFFSAGLVALERARDLNPLNTDNSANLGRLYRFWGEIASDASIRAERLETSQRYYTEALRLSPNSAHLLDEWGLVYAIQGRLNEAIEKYERSLALDPRYISTYAYLGDAYLSQNQLDKAEQVFRRAVGVDPSMVSAYIALGYIYHQQGRLQDSLAENLKAAEIAPRDLTPRRNMAIIYDELGMYDKSLAEAQVALSIAPEDQKASIQAFVTDLQRRRGGK